MIGSMRLFLALTLLCACSFAHAENQFSTWRKYTAGELWAEDDGVSPGQKITIGFHIKMEKHWHAYWVNPGDSGAPVKLSLSGRSSGGAIDLLSGPIEFPIPERLQTGPITSFIYRNDVLYLADVIVPDSLRAGDHLDLHLDAEWLVCADVCIPAFDKFDLSLPVKKAADVKPSAHAEDFLTWRGRLPRLMKQPPQEKRDGKTATYTFSKPSDFARFHFKDFFPLRGSQLSNARPELVSQTNGAIQLRQPIRAVGDRRADLVGLLLITDGKSTVGLQWGDPSYGFLKKEVGETATPKALGSVSLIWILLSAFLGGLILNLMPCVFPVLSIKLLSLVKHSGADSKKIRAENFAYTVGVVFSFLLIGIALSVLRGAGSFVGWGFQLQSGVFVLILAWLFFLLSLQLLGYFELTWLNPNMGGRLTKQKGWMGAFFTGVLAVVVASPCTAPFMGAALGFALAQSLSVLLLVFLLMGLGLAFPYLLFGLFPSWSRILPKPGRWMQTFKEIMAFPLLLTCVWLVWLLAQLKGDMAVALALSGMIAWVFVLWLRSNKIVSTVLSVILLLGGFKILHNLPDVSQKIATSSSALQWEPFRESQAVWDGSRPVFVDFTADWCLTCKVNERLVFDRSDVIQFLKDHGVRLLKGDWTKQDPAITRYLTAHQRVGVPFYIVFGPGAPNGKILPEVLTPEIFKSELEKVLQIKAGSR